jgi:hypothetical protein
MLKLMVTVVLVIMLVLVLSGCIVINTPVTGSDSPAPSGVVVSGQPSPAVSAQPSPVVSNPSGVIEKRDGVVSLAYFKDGAPFVDVDFIELYLGEQAWAEAAKDGINEVDDDIYIRNPDLSIATLPVDPACTVSLVEWEAEFANGIPMKDYPFSELVAKPGEPEMDPFLMHLVIKDGVVISMTEQYTP